MDHSTWASGARAALDRLAPGNAPVDLGTADAVAATSGQRAWAVVRSGSAGALLRTLLRLSRSGPESISVLLAGDLPARLGPVGLGDLSQILAAANPRVALLHLDGGKASPVLEGELLVPLAGSAATIEIEEVRAGLPPGRELLEVATYFDGTFLEYLGVPVAGLRKGELTVGIDRRDQEMMAEAEPTSEGRLAAAGRLLEVVLAARNGRLGRHDLSEFAPGRRLRSEAIAASPSMLPLEVSESGGSGARAYAVEGGDLWCFGRGTDPYLVVEGAVVARAVEGVSRIRFSASPAPHPGLVELAGMLATGCAAEFKGYVSVG